MKVYLYRIINGTPGTDGAYYTFENAQLELDRVKELGCWFRDNAFIHETNYTIDV